ncbi:hypothetical protein [Paenibacillus agaridevorans]|uniref:hypothetical protein n=1 Tax=Paenibacillus agaridevorans TaxID=171404 RepID=UPI001BE3ED77|nr:hypothetical protein [Paenibacillus agaridevorans]
MNKLIAGAGVAGATTIVEAAASTGPIGVLIVANPVGVVFLGTLAIAAVGGIALYAIKKGKKIDLGKHGSIG